jgi:glycosidase
MEYIFNPITNKSPSGASKCGGTVEYTVKISKDIDCKNLYIAIIFDKNGKETRTKMPIAGDDGEYFTFRAGIKYPDCGLYWYYFVVEQTGGHTYFLCKSARFDVAPRKSVDTSFAQFVYKTKSTVSKNYRSGAIYHIFVDRFHKSDKKLPSTDKILVRTDWGGEIDKNSKDFLVINREHFGGDLDGITEKIDYIKSLGVRTIYLSPIFSSSSYHKYDTADFSKIDENFGGAGAFARLLTAARKNGIEILLDGVFNHVGSDSIYFNKSARFDGVGAYQSKTSKYFDWFIFKKYPDDYSCWWGIDTLPQFNENCSGMQEYFAGEGGIIQKHMQSGVLGFRLDVVDECADVFLNKIAKRIKTVRPDGLVVGEVWEDAATKMAYGKRRNYFSGAQLDSVMNYPLKNAILDFVLNGDAENIASTFFTLADHYPIDIQNNLMNFLGTHDSARAFSVFKNSGRDAVTLQKIASAIQYCAVGVPSVFYGDEVGVQGGEAPFCRVCFPWDAPPETELLDWYKRLGALRANPVFADGKCNILFYQNGVFVFERVKGAARVVVAANCGGEDFQLVLKKPLKNFETDEIISDFVLLEPYNFVILYK